MVAGATVAAAMRTVYDTIELNTGFCVPELYRRMVADGVTRYGTSPADWKQTFRQRALENPPALMMASSQVEWWAPEDIANWEVPEHFDPAHGFVPFASTGAGDMWCWYPEAGPEVIVLAPHDENGATYFAPDTESFLLRHLVQAFAEIVEDDGTGFTHEQRSTAAHANVRTLAPYLNEGWVTLLEELAARPLVRDDAWDCVGLLSRDEAIDLIHTELAMDELGASFPHWRLAR